MACPDVSWLRRATAKRIAAQLGCAMLQGEVDRRLLELRREHGLATAELHELERQKVQRRVGVALLGKRRYDRMLAATRAELSRRKAAQTREQAAAQRAYEGMRAELDRRARLRGTRPKR